MSAVINGTNGITFPTWTTGTRPSSPAQGQAGYNTTIGAMETYTGSTWSTSDLPAVGASGNVLTSNGTSWASATPPSTTGGATSTTSGTSITLTSSSNRVQAISMTAASLSVTLPDATTISSLGGPIFQFINTGYFSYSIRDNSGGALWSLSAGDSISLSLISNSTAAGSWASEDAAFNVSTSEYTTVTSSFQSATPSDYAWLDNNFNISSDTISSSSAIVTWQQGTSGRDVYGAVVSYSGSTITVGTPTLIYSGSTTASVNNAVKMLSSTNGLILIQRASNIVCVPFTISGSTISVGTTSSTFGSAPSSGSSFGAITAMSSTVALVSYRTNAVASFTWVLNTITHNGSSAPTLGTASATVTSTSQGYQAPTISKIDATTAFIAYNAASPFYPVARIATLSGTSAPTLGTANTTSTDSFSNDGVSYPIYQISSTQFLLIGGIGSAYYTVSGTTVTYVSGLAYSTTGSASIANAYPGKLVFLGNNMLGNQFSSYNLLVGKIASNALYLKPSTALPKSMSFVNGGTSSSLAALDSTTAFGFTSNGTATISATIIKYIGA